jgi:hypothetical protein
MHLSLTPTTSISVIDEETGRMSKKLVSELVGVRKVYDWFGNIKNIEVKEAGEEQKIMTTATSGEMVTFGETHSVLCKNSDCFWDRRLLLGMEDTCSIKMPQKRITPDKGMLEFLDIDDVGLHLIVPAVKDFKRMMLSLASCGVKVNRHPSELRIELERSRAPCFATKLLNGSLIYNLEKTLGALAVGGVINPTELINKKSVAKIQETGIIFEGASLFNEVSLLPTISLVTLTKTYHVYLEDPITPVELDWFCS